MSHQEVLYENYSVGKYDAEVRIEATVFAGEPEVRYYSDGSDHPGSPPSVRIDAVIVEGVTNTLVDTDDYIEGRHLTDATRNNIVNWIEENVDLEDLVLGRVEG